MVGHGWRKVAILLFKYPSNIHKLIYPSLLVFFNPRGIRFFLQKFLFSQIDSNVSNSILEILKKHGKGNEGEMTKDEIEQIFKLFEGMGFDEKQKNGLGSIKKIFDGYLDNA